MKRLVFFSLILVIILVFTCNVFAFTFVEEGFPKEPDHNKKWIMFEIRDKKYYFETEKEIDLCSLGEDGYLRFDSDVLNNGKSIDIYEHDGTDWECKYSVSYWGFEIGKNYEILYSNYNIVTEFNMAEPYLKYLLNCVNLVDILSFCILIFSVVVSTTVIKRNRWLL